MVAKIQSTPPSQTLWDRLKPASRNQTIAAVAVGALLYPYPLVALGGAGLYTYMKVEQMNAPFASLLQQAPAFNGYKIGQGTSYPDTSLTSLSIRPANLFYRALLGRNAVTPPGGPLFAFNQPHDKIRKQIFSAKPQEIVSFSAQGVPAKIHSRARGTTEVTDLSALHGDAAYRVSYGELQSTLASQKIFVAPLLPVPFYRAFKEAMLKDGIVVLPGNDRTPLKVSQIQSKQCRALVAQAVKNFQKYGFQTKQHCLDILDLTLYQLGALVVKSEDFRIFIDGNGKILERNSGDLDAIRLINACGIRGILSTPRTNIDNQSIMKQTFQTALMAAESGFVIFPAVGMGVWRGDPDLYWRAFLTAVVHSNSAIERIFVNPNHQTTLYGRYQGCKGEEFRAILSEYRKLYAHDSKALANLAKIIDLDDRQTDVVQLARLLKKTYPDKSVSLFNASDPDVTLGNHVGEYVNNLDHCSTTEENYTALGTNGLCFETITGVHQDPRRVISVR